MQPEKPIDPLASVCMAITNIIDLALAMNLITQEEHTKIHTATWTARLNHTERVITPKGEAVQCSVGE